eukprot:7383351-Prymnesium_polylepis.3
MYCPSSAPRKHRPRAVAPRAAAAGQGAPRWSPWSRSPPAALLVDRGSCACLVRTHLERGLPMWALGGLRQRPPQTPASSQSDRGLFAVGAYAPRP